MASNTTFKTLPQKSADAQKEVYAYISWANTALDKLPVLTNDLLDMLNLDSLAISFSPFEYLFRILSVIGFTEEKFKKLIINILTTTLPALELSVKASLLSNIKTIIDCHFDPLIPEKYRKPYSNGYFTPRSTYNLIKHGEIDNRGLFISVDAIDPDYLLTMSPFSEGGRNYYFGQYTGIGKPCSPYQLVRANDMNAFLWFCIHKGKFPSPTMLNLSGSTINVGGKEYNVKNGRTLMDYIVLDGTKDNKPLTINVGNSFSSNANKNLLSVAVTSEPNKIEIVPVSDDWNSCNWYVDRNRYFSYNMTSLASDMPRDYGHEIGLFNIQYMKPSDYGDRYGMMNGNHNLKFSILPKPYVMTPMGAIDDSRRLKLKTNFSLVLFNSSGEVDKKGKYTINPSHLNQSGAWTNDKAIIIPFLDEADDPDHVFTFKSNSVYGIAPKSNPLNIITNDPGVYEKHLIECYLGLTIYEFNYDFVMGMRIFDPVVVTRRIIDLLFNPVNNAAIQIGLKGETTRGGSARKNNSTYANAKSRVDMYIKKLMEEYDDMSDCFYRFTNDEYEELLKKAAAARYYEQPYRTWNSDTEPLDISDINKILNGFPVEGTLEEQRDVITRTFETALEKAIIISEENINSSNGTSSFSSQNRRTLSVQFWFDICSILRDVLIESLITPKLLMLLEINQQIANDKETASITVDDLIKGKGFATPEVGVNPKVVNAISNIISAVIKEMLDLIAQKILDEIITYIQSLMSEIAKKIGLELAQSYLRVLMSLINLFKKGISTFEACNDIISSKLGENGLLSFNKNMGDMANEELTRMGFSYTEITTESSSNDQDSNTPLINNCL